jgi:hypothetical protein
MLKKCFCFRLKKAARLGGFFDGEDEGGIYLQKEPLLTFFWADDIMIKMDYFRGNL